MCWVKFTLSFILVWKKDFSLFRCMLYCEHIMQRESETDVHHADLTIYETWWKKGTSGNTQGCSRRPAREMRPMRTEMGVNGDLLWHTGPDVWGQCGQRLSGRRQSWLLIGLVLIMGPKALPRLFVILKGLAGRGHCFFFYLEIYHR